jgi:hypothetical protein
MSETEMIEQRLRQFVAVINDADWHDVVERADQTHRADTAARRGLPRRRLAVAVAVAAVALAIPALALSGLLSSLFGFSNQGTPLPRGDLSHVSVLLHPVLHITGATPGSLVQLASRDGWTFYAGRTPNGDICYFDQPAAQNPKATWKLIGGGACTNAAGKGDFPSPTLPVFGMFGFYNNVHIERLAGVAADGVASVQVLALSDCHVVATAPVIDNVFIADNLPLTIPEAQIVARDANGNVVWHQAVGAAIEPAPPSNSCGLG